MKRIALGSLSAIAIALFIIGCRGDVGPTGPAGEPGPAASYYDFSLVFTDTMPYGHYSLYGNTTYAINDAVITYWKADSITYVQLPYTFYSSLRVPIYLYTVIDNGYGQPWLWVMTERADSAAGSPWAAPTRFNFRAVVIHATAGKSAPKIDYGNYWAVKKYYNLSD